MLEHYPNMTCIHYCNIYTLDRKQMCTRVCAYLMLLLHSMKAQTVNNPPLSHTEGSTRAKEKNSILLLRVSPRDFGT